MPKFSQHSLSNLASAVSLLQAVFQSVIKIFDCSILEGHRGKAKQEAAFLARKTKVHYPVSKHNNLPSLAVDVAPFPICWVSKDQLKRAIKNGTPLKDVLPLINELLRWYHFAGIVKGVAHEQGAEIRWGGEWDGDFDFMDQNFDDVTNFEVKGGK